MKVALDARALKVNGGGISLYIERIINYLPKDLEILAFCREGLSVEDFNFSSNVKIINLPTNTSGATEGNLKIDREDIPKILKEKSIDVYHACANWGVQDISEVPTILTIHDIIPLVIREADYKDDKVFGRYKELLERSIRTATKIITISRFSEGEIVKRFNVADEKISVIYNGADEPSNTKSISSTIKKFNLMAQKYFVYIGGFYERKNLNRLVDAFININKEYPNYKLIVTGDNSSNHYVKEQYKVFTNQIKGYEDKIKYAGYVERSILNDLISQSSALVFPSVFEGFGLPIIEGMALETLVLSSNKTSLPEVGGEVAIYFDPNNIDEITEKLKIIAAGNIDRDVRIKMGKKLAQKFTWEKCVKETYKMYLEVNNGQ